MQEQVDDEQGGKHEAYIIVHRDPLVTGDTKAGRPAAPESSFRQDKIEDKSGDQRRDERDKASDVHECIDGYGLQLIIILSGLRECGQ